MNLTAAITAAKQTLIGVNRVWHWWIRTLSSLLPTHVVDREIVRIEAREVGTGYELRCVRPGREAVICNFDSAESSELKIEDFRYFFRGSWKNPSLWIIPSGDHILRRDVEIPIEAYPNFSNLLRLELDKWSPFRLDDVYVGWRGGVWSQGSTRMVELRMVSRQAVDDVVNALSVLAVSQTVLIVGADPEFRVSVSGNRSRSMSVSKITLISSVILACSILWIDWLAVSNSQLFWQTKVRSQLHDLSAQRKLEKKIASYLSAIDEARNTISKNQILASLSEVLPPTDWFTEVKIKGNSISIRGYCFNIDDLVRAIKALAKNNDVLVQGEIVFDQSKKAQRFAISFELGI